VEHNGARGRFDNVIWETTGWTGIETDCDGLFQTAGIREDGQSTNAAGVWRVPTEGDIDSDA
jgi:hypothetical protein